MLVLGVVILAELEGWIGMDGGRDGLVWIEGGMGAWRIVMERNAVVGQSMRFLLMSGFLALSLIED